MDTVKIKRFLKNNAVSAALDNILAMFPSTILMPILINSALGYDYFSISLVLFITGLGTLLYVIITKGRLPCYLGSSFAFIGTTTYIATTLSQQYPQDEVFAYIMGGYLCSGLLLLLLSGLCKLGDTKAQNRTMKIINGIIPTSVMGPAISLIGLELSNQAVEKAGLTHGIATPTSKLAFFTVIIIIILSVTRRPIFKKSSILLGIVIAGIVAAVMGVWDLTPVFQAPIIQVPEFKFMLPKFSLGVLITVIPPTLILFCEHIGRKIMIENLQNSVAKENNSVGDEQEKISLARSSCANAAANCASALLCGVPLTLYAENVAIMRINNDTRSNQFYLASIFVMFLSFSGNLLVLIQSIPDPILGGLSLVLMGVIAAPGIKMLVDAKINYLKITNLFLTASVLIAGLSKMSVVVAGTELKGMSLGLLVGICLNAIFVLLQKLNIIKEHMSFDELTAFCNEYDKPDDDIFCRISENGKTVQYHVNHIKFVEIVSLGEELLLKLRTNETDDDCILKYHTPKAEGWITLKMDGSLSRKTIETLILNSLRLAREEQASIPKTQPTNLLTKNVADMSQ